MRNMRVGENWLTPVLLLFLSAAATIPLIAVARLLLPSLFR
jgi:hypothetical protein